mgnify:CR=1 FL=1
MNPADVVLDGSLLAAIPLALAAGLISFLSPCVLPLVPGYLSYLTGMTHSELLDSESSVKQRSRILIGTFGFVLGFSVLFVSYGLAFGELGNWFLQHARPVSVVLGVLVVLMGASYLGWLPALNVRHDAREDPPARSGLMIAAHAVWGAAAGYELSSGREQHA